MARLFKLVWSLSAPASTETEANCFSHMFFSGFTRLVDVNTRL